MAKPDKKRRRIHIESAVDFASVVTTYLNEKHAGLAIAAALARIRKTPRDKTVNCEKKKFTLTFRNKEATYVFRNINIATRTHKHFKNSYAFWIEKNTAQKTTFLCELDASRYNCEAQSYFFHGLQQVNCDEETMAKFAASQLIGRHVNEWADLLQALYPYTPDLCLVPSLESKEMQMRCDQVFQTFKFLNHYPTEARDPSLEMQLEISSGNTLGVLDMHAATLNKACVYQKFTTEATMRSINNAQLLKILGHVARQSTEKLTLSSTDTFQLCEEGRYVRIVGHLTTMEEKVLPEDLALRSSSLGTLRKAAQWTFTVLKYFYPNPNGGTLQEIQEKFKTYPLFNVYDLAQPTFEDMFVYHTQGFVDTFENPLRLLDHVDKMDYPLRCIWDFVLRPIWSGAVPTVETTVHGKSYSTTVYMHPGKRFYVSVYEEKGEAEGMDLLANSAVPAIQEEVPDGNDWRPTMFRWYRFLSRKPTKAHDPAALHTFLTSIRATYPESDKVMFHVLDCYCRDFENAIVYESPILKNLYGPHQRRRDRIKQGGISFHQCYKFIKAFMQGQSIQHQSKILRVDNQTIDTVTLNHHSNNDRYFLLRLTVTESQPYVPPQQQSSWWGETYQIL